MLRKCVFMNSVLHKGKTVKCKRDTKIRIILFILLMHIRERLVICMDKMELSKQADN